MIFASENLENPDDLVDAVVNMTINDVGYELNTATTGDTKVKLPGNSYGITHTSNKTNHQMFLSSRTIRI